MPSDFGELAGGLICPDDRCPLRHRPGRFACPNCGRVFPVLESRVLELLPRVPVEMPGRVSASYRREYQEEFRRPLDCCSGGLPWGAPETQPPGWMRKRQRQAAAILARLTAEDISRLVLCDVSAGAGLYTFAAAPYFRTVLHCDLCADSLSYGLAQARRRNLDNVLFLRVDYLRLPFAPVLDRVLCLDTLIRGLDHERLLLAGLSRCLAPEGQALVDFHNWWHNPLRRLGLLPQNFHDCSSYTRRSVSRLLGSLGVKVLQHFGFVQEVNSAANLSRLAERLLPPARLVYALSFERPIPRL